MRATSVGPDLSRVIVRIEKPGYTGPDADPGAAAVAAAGKAADEDAAAGDDQVQSGDAADSPTPLPLSA
jgi:single-strand DNA-binding protein